MACGPDDFYTLYENLSATSQQGRPPKHVMVAANTFPRGWARGIGGGGTGLVDHKWDTAVRHFEQMYGLTGNDPWPRNCTTDEQRRMNCTTDFAISGGNGVAVTADGLQLMVCRRVPTWW